LTAAGLCPRRLGEAIRMPRLDNSRHPAYTRAMRQESDLTTLNVSLPRPQREFVEAEAARSGCTTTSEYVRRLIHDAQKRASHEELERKILQGLDSGDAIDITPEYWEKKRRELAERFTPKQS
jgi:antitoxin ParD1/3/4